jgi:hypothetical protein
MEIKKEIPDNTDFSRFSYGLLEISVVRFLPNQGDGSIGIVGSPILESCPTNRPR